VLASPTAMVAALATASRNGILVKSSAFFEKAREIDAVVFDKTGTLTTGKLKVVRVETARGVEEAQLLRVAAGAESQSKHPMARAVLEHARTAGIDPVEPEEFQEHHGRGVEALWQGSKVYLGKPVWVREHLSVEEQRQAGDGDDGSFTALMVARDQKYLGKLILRDTVRDDARAAAADLRALGIKKMRMLTGDRRAVAEAIAGEVGLTEVIADCLPEDKLRSVEELKEAGYRVLVIGDGINDAPALARGDLGVAMGAMGSDVAIQTADVALMKNDLRRLVFFLQLSRRTIGLINQNIFFGFLFIGLFMIISMLGLVPPVLAALLHEFSAFFVIFNSARLLRIDAGEG
jgi:Cd2+/Zn2+-exporting ATPase